MSLYNGVREGTRPDAVHLCDSCRNALVIRGPSASRDRWLCRAASIPVQVTHRVPDCSGYDNKAMPSMGDLYETAWVLATSSATRKIGFLSPEERRNLPQMPPAGPSLR